MMEYAKQCYGAFPGNKLNRTKDCSELKPWLFPIAGKLNTNSVDSLDVYKAQFIVLHVQIFNNAKVNGNNRPCILKYPGLVHGPILVIKDLMLRAKFLAARCRAVPYACRRKQTHELGLKTHISGQTSFGAIHKHYYGSGVVVNWNLPSHMAMTLIWIAIV